MTNVNYKFTVRIIVADQDRSILRKNIGRAYLNAKKDPFLEQWEYDLTSTKNREKYLNLVDLKKLQKIEVIVSMYIQDHFSFVVMEVVDKELRLRYESKLISTVSLCKACSPSNNWFGLYSPKNKIRESGLWLVNELYKQSSLPSVKFSWNTGLNPARSSGVSLEELRSTAGADTQPSATIKKLAYLNRAKVHSAREKTWNVLIQVFLSDQLCCQLSPFLEDTFQL